MADDDKAFAALKADGSVVAREDAEAQTKLDGGTKSVTNMNLDLMGILDELTGARNKHPTEQDVALSPETIRALSLVFFKVVFPFFGQLFPARLVTFIFCFCAGGGGDGAKWKSIFLE